MSKLKFSEDMVGKEVIAIIGRQTAYFPKKGTKGKIVAGGYDNYIVVEWPKGTVEKNRDGKYSWATSLNMVDFVKKDEDMTSEEIWEMLKSKMEENKFQILNSHEISLIKMYGYDYKYYTENDFHNAIALAYCFGYERAMKGRPFKFGEKKKQGGHWEPIDSNNLPKEGTRVRYSRQYKGYDWLKDSLPIGAKGTLTIDDPYSRIGMMLDTPTSFLAWTDFEDEEAVTCLDMWVEDDE